MLPVDPSKVHSSVPSRTKSEGPSRDLLETSDQIDAFCNPIKLSRNTQMPEGYFKGRSVKPLKADPTEGIFNKILG